MSTTDPTVAQTARRPISYDCDNDTGPCEGRHLNKLTFARRFYSDRATACRALRRRAEVLIRFFSNGNGTATGPVGEVVAERVLAYYCNHDLIRYTAAQPKTVTRDPFLEVQRGNPERIEALTDVLRTHKRSPKVMARTINGGTASEYPTQLGSQARGSPNNRGQFPRAAFVRREQ